MPKKTESSKDDSFVFMTYAKLDEINHLGIRGLLLFNGKT